MKWFFALNDNAFEFARYAELLTVAVHTAAKYTDLEPYCLYDGQDNALTDWLRAQRVTIVPCKSFLVERLRALAANRGDENIVAIGSGAFLRVEIPQIALEIGIREDVVLYTDLDVMFMGDVKALESLAPRYFAVGPEFNPRDFVRMNTGVMLMNLRRLREIDSDFRQFVARNLATLIELAWDQGAYRRYFWRIELLAKVFGTKWDRLPVEFNWKPYWGRNDAAKIVHFHGPKPHHADLFSKTDRIPNHQRWMVKLATAEYRRLADQWRCHLRDAVEPG